MKIRAGLCYSLIALTVFGTLQAQSRTTTSQQEMDRDLLEVTIPQLEELYRSHKYTVTQVVQWHIARIRRYNGIYRAVQNLDDKRSSRHGCARGRGGSERRQQLSSRPPLGRPDRHQGQHQHQGTGHHRWLEGLHHPRPRTRRAERRHHRRKTARRRSRHPRADQHARLRRQRYQSQHRLRAHRQCL